MNLQNYYHNLCFCHSNLINIYEVYSKRHDNLRSKVKNPDVKLLF